MKVFKSIHDLPKWKHPVVTQGTFDGVHVGHRKLISTINQLAERQGGESVLLSYHPHPRLVLNPNDSSLKLINTLEERIELLGQAGIQNLILLEFNWELAAMKPDIFIKDVLIEGIGTKELVVGYDHRFGKNRRGSLADLRKFEANGYFGVLEVSAQETEDITISSTKVRTALLEGEIGKANTLLGSSFVLSGEVVAGKQLGRELGFPTANLSIPNPNKIIPKEGVYAVHCDLNGRIFAGMLSIGRKPTLEEQDQTIEVHIFNFDEEIYGQSIKLIFREWIRENKKFADLQLLKEQLEQDKRHIQKLL